VTAQPTYAFDLRYFAEVVREVQSETGAVSPHDVADAFVSLLDAEQLAAFARCMAPTFVLDVQRRDRETVRNTAPPPEPAQQASVTKLPGARKGRSRKATNVTVWHVEFLEQVVHLPNKKSKRFGDCTFEDVATLVTERRKSSRRLEAVALQFERLLETMTRLGVSRVSDVPPADAALIFSPEERA